MERIRSLLACLKPQELLAVKDLYNNSLTEKRNKRRELLFLVLDNPDLSEKEICQKLYGTPPNSSFSHLKKKLFQDILKVFYIVDPETQAGLPKNINKIYVRRMIQIIEHLIMRNVGIVLQEVAGKSLSICDKYEFYEEKLIILQTMFGKSAYVKNRKKFDEVYSTLKETIKHVNDYTESQRLKYELFGSFMNYNPVEGVDAETHMKALQSLHKQAKLARVSFNYYQGAIYYYENIGQFQNAIQAAEDMEEFLVENPPVFSKTDLAGIQMKLAHFNYIEGLKVKALEKAQNAMSIFRSGTYNEWIMVDFIFRIYLFEEDLNEAEQYLKRYKSHNAFKVNKSNQEVYSFYTAALQFRKGNIQESMVILNKNSNLKQLDIKWFIQNRVLDMMCQLESGNYDIFEFKLNAFRKQFYSNFQNKDDRDTEIYNILKSMNKCSFDYHEVELKNEKSLKKLTESKGKYFWHPLGWELIRFDKWIKEKVKKQTRSLY